MAPVTIPNWADSIVLRTDIFIICLKTVFVVNPDIASNMPSFRWSSHFGDIWHDSQVVRGKPDGIIPYNPEADIA